MTNKKIIAVVGATGRCFTELGVPTTFLITSFYWDNFIHFGMGPAMGPDGKLAITCNPQHHFQSRGRPMKPHAQTTALSTFLLAAAFLSLVSCDGKDSASNTVAGTSSNTSPAEIASNGTPVEFAGSCHYPLTGTCVEWTGASWNSLKMDRLCASQKGMRMVGACPTEGALGSCLRDKGKPSESRFFYYSNFPGYGVTLTAEKAAESGQDQCNRLMKGEWNPSAG